MKKMTDRQFGDVVAKAEREGYFEVKSNPKNPRDPFIRPTEKLMKEWERAKLKLLEAMSSFSEAEAKEGLTFEQVVERSKLHPYIVMRALESLKKEDKDLFEIK